MGVVINLKRAVVCAIALLLSGASVTTGSAQQGVPGPEEAQRLNKKAVAEFKAGNYVQAEADQKLALAGAIKAFGPGHPNVATTLNNLAQIYQATARYAQAEAMLRQALAIQEKTLGPAHNLVATTLNNLGELYRETGRFADAEPLYRRALAIWEKTGGPNGPDAATAVTNLSLLYDQQGRLAEAETLARQALAIKEKTLNPKDPSIALSLHNLAAMLRNTGRFGEAEPLEARALIIWAGALGENHPYVAESLNSLGIILQFTGRATNAEPLHRRALAIREKVLSPNHPDIAISLNSLALTLDATRRYTEAEPLHRRALSIWEKAYGPSHPRVAAGLHSLALSYQVTGRCADALPLYQRALAIGENTLGPNHRDVQANLTNLSTCSLQLGRASEALAQSRRALAADQAIVGLASVGAGEDAQIYSQRRQGNAARIVTLAAFRAAKAPGASHSDLRAEAFAAAQSIYASGAAQAFAQGAARLAAQKAGQGALVAGWRDTQLRLAQLDKAIAAEAAKGAAGDAARGALLQQRNQAKAQFDSAEQALKLKFPRFFDLVASPDVPLAETQGLLAANEALVLLTTGGDWLPEGYRRGLVFAVTREAAAWAEISLTSGQIETAIAALRAQLDSNSGGGWNAPGAKAFDRAGANRLYQALFGAPEIQALIASKTKLVLAPQGALLSAPYAALVSAPPLDGKAGDAAPAALRATHWLGIEKSLSITPSISALKAQRQSQQQPLAARTTFFGIGDPAFDGKPATREQIDSATLFANRSGLANAVRQLPRLPGTRGEVLRMAKDFNAGPDAVLLDLAATEAAVKARSADGRLAQSAIILFATHALIAGDFEGLVEPALALTPPTGASSTEDGLLTASEASALQLSARWVILSACNTAAGGKAGADGLTGLAKGFFYAGAQSLLVSQWPVFDEAAARLTTGAVEASAKDKIGAPEALRSAMTALMMDASADSQDLPFAHPAVWAPFMLVSGN